MRSNKKDRKLLELTSVTEWQLWHCFEVYDFVKYQRWYKGRSYFRFRIFDNSFKIIISPSYKPFSSQTIHYDGSWVINATQWYGTEDELLQTCVDIHNWWVKYYTEEEMAKMAEFADADNINYEEIGYEYIMKPDGAFSICHSDALDAMANDLAKRYIEHLHLKDNRFGALYEVMSVLTHILYDCTIDEKERMKVQKGSSEK